MVEQAWVRGPVIHDRRERMWSMSMSKVVVGILSVMGVSVMGVVAPLKATTVSKPRLVMEPVTVLRVGSVQGKHVVLLETKDRKNLVPIFIGEREAQAIYMGIRGIRPTRPLTHNLLLDVIKRLGGKILRVEVTHIRNTVFIGSLVLQDLKKKTHRVDARPSDLVALAATQKLPIYVSSAVIRKAGIAKPSGSGGGSSKGTI